MKHDRLRRMCLTGFFTAVVFVFTAYLHIPVHTGYVHVGDGFIYLAACLLPTPYAVFVGGAGALLADCLTGFAAWAPGSAVIKAAAVLCFSGKGQRIVTRRNALALIPAGGICVGGYYLYEALITGSMIAPLAGILGNAIQSVLSGILFVAVGAAMDAMHIKQTLNGGKQL